MAGLTKAQLAERRAAEEAEMQALRTQVAEAESRAREADRRAEWFEQQGIAAPEAHPVDELEVQTRTSVVDDERELDDPELLSDPFSAQHPHKFLRHPPGLHLGWKNPKYRDGHANWQGWQQVQFDDAVGRHLDRYLLEPPKRMAHNVDNYVRRGDLILCVLDEKLWNLRRRVAVDKATRYQKATANGPDDEFTQVLGPLRAGR